VSDETERLDVIEHAHAEGVAAAASLGEGLSSKANRRDVWIVAAVFACLGAALSIGVSLVAASQVVEWQAQRTAELAKTAAEQEHTRQAIAALEEANKDLRRRGQQPVNAPADMQAEDTLVAAATARVLATLPTAPLPTAQQVSDAIASYLVTNPVSVSPVLVAHQVSAYLTANPPAAAQKGEQGIPGTPGVPGEKGEKGDPGTAGDAGHTPTPEEIIAVFNQAAAQSPDLLCAGKGKFTEVRGFVKVPPELVPQERAFWVCLPQ
jgi:hypothetical protein